jgi:hypothetical protein
MSPAGVIRNRRRPIPLPVSCSEFQSVLVMQPAQQRLRDDSRADRQATIRCTLAGRLALRIRDARSQTRMRASVVVMSDPLREYPTDVLLVEWNHIRTLTTALVSPASGALDRIRADWHVGATLGSKRDPDTGFRGRRVLNTCLYLGFRADLADRACVPFVGISKSLLISRCAKSGLRYESVATSTVSDDARPFRQSRVCCRL